MAAAAQGVLGFVMGNIEREREESEMVRVWCGLVAYNRTTRTIYCNLKKKNLFLLLVIIIGRV